MSKFMVKWWKEITYTIGVPKVYYPKEIQPTIPGGVHQYIVKIKAETRTAAAHKAWELYGKNWLKQMTPKQTSVRKISLDVDEPSAGTGGALGRLPAIQVYSEGSMNKAEKLLKLVKEQSVANLGAIPSPALAVVPRPGTSYKLDIPMITKKKRKKKKQPKEAVSNINSRRTLYHKRSGEKGKTYDIDIGPGKKTLSGVYGTPR